MKRDDRYNPTHPRHHELMLTPAQSARAQVQHDAEQAGLDDDTVDACVDDAMSSFDKLGHDKNAWRAHVASVIQRHAAP